MRTPGRISERAPSRYLPIADLYVEILPSSCYAGASRVQLVRASADVHLRSDVDATANLDYAVGGDEGLMANPCVLTDHEFPATDHGHGRTHARSASDLRATPPEKCSFESKHPCLWQKAKHYSCQM